jgi:hypothetical protein
MPSVLQSWLEEIPIRMQSTLLLSLRGPDTHRCPEIKKIQRWMRGLTFRPGNPDNVDEFMTHRHDLPKFSEKGPLDRELDFCTRHFYSHLMHGLEVIAYRYPDSKNDLGEAATAWQLYCMMCAIFHVAIEDKEDFEERLKQIDWPGQPENFEQAIEMMGGLKLK